MRRISGASFAPAYFATGFASDALRFAYKYNLPLDKTKQMILAYVEDGVLLHFPNSEDVADYVEL